MVGEEAGPGPGHDPTPLIPAVSPPPPGSVPPPKNVTSWFTSKGLGKALDEVTVTIPHDIYVFGTQENSVGDREWLDLLRGGLKELTDLDYRPVRGLSLLLPGSHRLCVFCLISWLALGSTGHMTFLLSPDVSFGRLNLNFMSYSCHRKGCSSCLL